MDLRAVIDEMVSRMEDLPADARTREKVRATLIEMVGADYSHLTLDECRTAVLEVTAILQHDDFFGIEFAGDAFDPEDDDPEI